MRIQQLQYLEKIVERGSINEAAKELFLSQPSFVTCHQRLGRRNGDSNTDSAQRWGVVNDRRA